MICGKRILSLDIILKTAVAIFVPDSVSFINWGNHKIRFLYGIASRESVRAFTTESSSDSYLQMFIIGDNSRRVFLHLYLSAYGKTAMADFAQEGFFVFSYAFTHMTIQSLQRESKCCSTPFMF